MTLHHSFKKQRGKTTQRDTPAGGGGEHGHTIWEESQSFILEPAAGRRLPFILEIKNAFPIGPKEKK